MMRLKPSQRRATAPDLQLVRVGRRADRPMTLPPRFFDLVARGCGRGALTLLLLAPAPHAAAGPPDRLEYGFTGAIGYGHATGAVSDFLDDTWSAEFALFMEKGRFRGGIGAEFHRFRTKDGVEFPEFSEVPFYLHGAFTPWPQGRFRPYLQGRLGLQRLHAQPTLDRAGPGVNGWSYALVPGLEIDLTPTVALDVSLGFLGHQTDSFRFGEAPEAQVETGGAFTGRFGLTWRPRVYGSGPPRPGSPEPGPWGVRRSPGIATGELMVTLAFASIFNEYFHDANFVQVSPRAWWRNLERGFEYDQNKFDTNHFYHPWNGALFYSTGRSNGIGFWGSSALALGGSFLWECCGETLTMSVNDLVSTSLGGVAMGEMTYRLGSVVLDNSDTGSSRFLRELTVFAFDIVRGSNRLIWNEQRRAPNPEDPFEWRPRRLGAILAAGARQVGDEGSLSGEGAKTASFLDLWVAYGSVFDNERRRPYDSFWVQTQVNFTDEVDPAGLMTIRGDLLSKPLGDAGARNGAVALVQHFDYVNQATYEFGAQSLALGLSHRMRFSPSTRLELHGELLGTVLGSINSRFEFVEAPENEKEYRRWEYGPGLGARAEALLLVGEHPVVQATYRYQWIHVTNGTPENGGDADHDLQIAALRLRAPIGGRFGVGIDGELFLRKSHYGNPLLVEGDERVPQVRVYATWRLGGF